MQGISKSTLQQKASTEEGVQNSVSVN